jgi:hypothetical protein
VSTPPRTRWWVEAQRSTCTVQVPWWPTTLEATFSNADRSHTPSEQGTVADPRDISIVVPAGAWPYQVPGCSGLAKIPRRFRSPELACRVSSELAPSLLV